MGFKDFHIFSFGDHLILATLVEGNLSNIPLKFE